MHNFEKSVYIDISTFDCLKEKGQTVIEISENILKNFFLHYDYPTKVYIENFNFQNRNYTIKSWNKIISIIQKEEIRHLLINTVRNSDSIQPELSLSVTFDYSYNDKLYDKMVIANNISFSLKERFLNLETPKIQQKLITETFIDIFKNINAVVGFIDIGYRHATIIPNSTSFEEAHKCSFVNHSNMFRKNARGFFWGNILSEEHIYKLGGINTIREKAPCYHIKSFNFGDGRNAVYMQLSENINHYTEDELNSLGNFLKPVLPAVNSIYCNILNKSFECI
ncbi:MAG: hypothetical protein KAZ87_08885 [Spirochaetes bacterium]|nr:hypothetical protein [Spirochaetota bacterium]